MPSQPSTQAPRSRDADGQPPAGQAGPRSVEPLPAARTRTEALRLRLEQDILARRVGPGEKLDEEDIAARFGLSRTPVREALKALTASGLIEIRPHQGAFVAKPTPRAIAEMVELMAVMETACAELAAKRHSADDRNRIVRAQAACRQAAGRDDGMRFYAANIVFHDAIYAASQNGFMAEQAQALRQRLEPYRRQISFHPGLMEKSIREHDLVVEAILAMDCGAAGVAMRGHLEDLRDSITVMMWQPSGPMEPAPTAAR